MKKPEIYLKEYCAKLSDDNVRFLQGRLNQRLAGDLPEAVEFLSSFRELDKWLLSASDYNEFYDMIDIVQHIVQKEHEKRLAASVS
jgi:hypothetical protein